MTGCIFVKYCSLKEKWCNGPTEISYLILVRFFVNQRFGWDKHTPEENSEMNKIHDSEGQKIQNSALPKIISYLPEELVQKKYVEKIFCSAKWPSQE